MAFDKTPTDKLKWGDAANAADFRAANRGQWFLGVLDTANKKVYILPSDLEPPDVYDKKRATSGDKPFVGRPQPGVPTVGWQSTPLFGSRSQEQGINTQPSGDSGGLRQHIRVIKAYKCAPADCLGFAVIKMTDEFGEFRDRSNSLNDDASKFDDNPRRSPSGRSARMPEGWSDAVKKWLIKELKVTLQDSAMP